jgi:ubiquinone/menaquinone biosynthesis C-methylase UbiE
MGRHGTCISRGMPFLHKAGVQRLFDGLALKYACGRERQPTFVAQKQVVLAMLRDAEGRVLDVGCGPAVMEAELLRRGFQVTGIDTSIEMLRHGLNRLAGTAGRDRCRLVPGDAERLEFPDGTFDAVICMGVLEYLPTYNRALAEMRRVLRDDGMAVLSVPNRVSPYHLALAGMRQAKRMLGRPAPSFVPNRCVPWFLERSLQDRGLKVEETRLCGAQYIVKARRAHP